jgi:cytochrome c oxidase cbb3-type subunit 4
LEFVMDVNDLRIVVTVLSMVTFLGIVRWAYSGRRGFEEAAMLPFADDGEFADLPAIAGTQQNLGSRP